MATRRPTDSGPQGSSANDGPKTLKEAFSDNVKTQQARADRTASPPEAQRSPSERIESRERLQDREEHDE